MRRICIVLWVTLVAALIVGCHGTVKTHYGKAIPAAMKQSNVGDLLANPQGFEGHEVLVQGRITSECPAGGWIWLKDSTGEIYVNMHPTNVFIPQRVGSNAQVLGKVVLEQGRPQVVGYGVKF
ncbi:MAG: hypothetical protein ABIK62_02220 [candidate division WOR-3 bacterium]